MRLFGETPPPAGYTLVGIEEPFEIKLSDDLPPLTGRIDALLLAENDPEAILIVDYKTASAAYQDGKANNDGQLSAYSLALGSRPFAV